MVKITLWGLGAMGSGIAKLLRSRNYPIVSAWDRDPQKIGRSLQALLADEGDAGPLICEPTGEYPEPGNLLIIATGSFVPEVYPLIMEGIAASQHVITIAEEMAYPWASHPEIAAKMDAAAQAQQVSVLGSGINPGFVLDSFVGFLTASCLDVERINARRVNDLSPFGPTVLKSQGVGSTPAEFAQGVADGTIVGHIGFPESIHLIANMLGWKIDHIEQHREPIISNTARSTPFISIEPGQVAGCNHRAWGFQGEECMIQLEHPQQICPEAEHVATGDHISIQGNPGLTMDIQPEIPGGLGTIAVAVNVIPKLISAAPGLRTMADLVIPSCR